MEAVASISTIVMVAVGLFLLYRTGAMELTQTASKRAITVTDSATEVWELSALESHSKKFGKIAKKLSDKSTDRSSAKSIRTMLKNLESTTTE